MKKIKKSVWLILAFFVVSVIALDSVIAADGPRGAQNNIFASDFNIQYDDQKGLISGTALVFNASSQTFSGIGYRYQVIAKDQVDTFNDLDIQIADEKLTIGGGEEITKNISYAVPSFIGKGEYVFRFQLTDSQGRLLGYADAEFSRNSQSENAIIQTNGSDTKIIVNEKDEYSWSRGIEVESSDKIELSFKIKNSGSAAISGIVPSLVVNVYDQNGRPANSQSFDQFALESGEEKAIKYEMPKFNEPQSYLATIALSQNGKTIAPLIQGRWVIKGVQGKILSAGADEENIKLEIVGSPFNENKPVKVAGTLISNGKVCFEFNQDVGSLGAIPKTITIPVVSGSGCVNPEVSAQLIIDGKMVDAKGIEMDETDFKAKPVGAALGGLPEGVKNPALWVFVVFLLMSLGLGAFWAVKRCRTGAKSVIKIFLFFVLGGFSLFSLHSIIFEKHDFEKKAQAAAGDVGSYGDPVYFPNEEKVIGIGSAQWGQWCPESQVKKIKGEVQAYTKNVYLKGKGPLVLGWVASSEGELPVQTSSIVASIEDQTFAQVGEYLEITGKVKFKNNNNIGVKISEFTVYFQKDENNRIEAYKYQDEYGTLSLAANGGEKIISFKSENVVSATAPIIFNSEDEIVGDLETTIPFKTHFLTAGRNSADRYEGFGLSGRIEVKNNKNIPVYLESARVYLEGVEGMLLDFNCNKAANNCPLINPGKTYSGYFNKTYSKSTNPPITSFPCWCEDETVKYPEVCFENSFFNTTFIHLGDDDPLRLRRIIKPEVGYNEALAVAQDFKDCLDNKENYCYLHDFLKDAGYKNSFLAWYGGQYGADEPVWASPLPNKVYTQFERISINVQNIHSWCQNHVDEPSLIRVSVFDLGSGNQVFKSQGRLTGDQRTFSHNIPWMKPGRYVAYIDISSMTDIAGDYTFIGLKREFIVKGGGEESITVNLKDTDGNSISHTGPVNVQIGGSDTYTLNFNGTSSETLVEDIVCPGGTTPCVGQPGVAVTVPTIAGYSGGTLDYSQCAYNPALGTGTLSDKGTCVVDVMYENKNLNVELKASTDNGTTWLSTINSTAALHDIDLQANVTAGFVSGQPATYQFYCDQDDAAPIKTLDDITDNIVPAMDVCDYGSSGNYVPKVVVTQGTKTGQGTAAINVNIPCTPDYFCANQALCSADKCGQTYYYGPCMNRCTGESVEDSSCAASCTTDCPVCKPGGIIEANP